MPKRTDNVKSKKHVDQRTKSKPKMDESDKKKKKIQRDDASSIKRIDNNDPYKTIIHVNQKTAFDGLRWANPLNGQSGRGMCYRNGIVRIGGKSFMRALNDVSEAFILESLIKMVAVGNIKRRAIITEQAVRCALKTMHINPMIVDDF